MRGLLLFLLAFSLGFVAAIPIGGSQVEMAKRAVHGHLLAAAAVILGSVSSDVMYGAVALFGIAPLLDTPWVLASLNAAGAVVLWVLAFLTFRASRRPHELSGADSPLASRRWAYLTGFSLAVSNPQMMLSWLLAVALAKHLGLASPFPASAKVLFIGGGVAGLGGYLTVLGAVVYRLKHFIPLAAIGRVYVWLAFTLVALSALFVYGAVRFFLVAS
ncbi:MAG: LysE family transporter [Gemmatimonadales bacterium]